MATKDPDALPPDGADQPPTRLVRTIVAAILCLVWGGISVLMSLWQVLMLTVLGNVMGDLQAAQRAQMAELQATQEARAIAERDAEVAVIEKDLALAKLDKRDVDAVQLEARLDVARSRSVAVAPVPGSEMLKFQESLETPFMEAWQAASALIGLVLYSAVIAAGVGLLRRRPWGRSLAVGTTAFALAIGIIGSVGMCVAVLSAVDVGPIMRSPMGWAMLGAGACSFGCSFGPPGVILFLMLMRPVREECAVWAGYGAA